MAYHFTCPAKFREFHRLRHLQDVTLIGSDLRVRVQVRYILVSRGFVSRNLIYRLVLLRHFYLLRKRLIYDLLVDPCYDFLVNVTIYNSVVQPVRHSPHVANGRLSVANGFIFKKFKIRMFLGKNRNYKLN